METWAPRVGHELAAKAFGVAPRTWAHHRQQQRGELPARKSRATGEPRKPHPAKLSDVEEQGIAEVLCSDRFVDAGVTQVWATLLDEGVYLCSESTMHRVLRDRELAGQRRQRDPNSHAKPRVVAKAPNEVWVWDITRIPGPVKGSWFYKYTVMDLFSRMIVGWCVDVVETGDIAERLIREICVREGIDYGQLTIHSDRGTQMKSGVLAELYDLLGIDRSLSRPRVSNDNPHAEAVFKTMKYHPDWPGSFDTLSEAITGCERFVDWYNYSHHHRGIGLLTPADCHTGRGPGIAVTRQATLDRAYEAHPERFTRGRPTAPKQPTEVWINPPTNNTTK